MHSIRIKSTSKRLEFDMKIEFGYNAEDTLAKGGILNGK